MAVTNPLGIDLDQYKYGFHDPEDAYAFKSRKGLDREIVEMISHMKSEPDWMRAFRLHSLGVWDKKPLPTWGGNVGEIDFNDIVTAAQTLRECAINVGDRGRVRRRTFRAIAVDENDRRSLAARVVMDTPGADARLTSAKAVCKQPSAPHRAEHHERPEVEVVPDASSPLSFWIMLTSH